MLSGNNVEKCKFQKVDHLASLKSLYISNFNNQVFSFSLYSFSKKH